MCGSHLSRLCSASQPTHWLGVGVKGHILRTQRFVTGRRTMPPEEGEESKDYCRREAKDSQFYSNGGQDSGVAGGGALAFSASQPHAACRQMWKTSFCLVRSGDWGRAGRGAWAHQALHTFKAPSQGSESLPLVTPGPTRIWSPGPAPIAPATMMYLGCCRLSSSISVRQ